MICSKQVYFQFSQVNFAKGVRRASVGGNYVAVNAPNP